MVRNLVGATRLNINASQNILDFEILPSSLLFSLIEATAAMRLFLLPISSKQNLIYCQRLNKQLSQQAPTFLDRLSTKATTTWLGWEKKDTGWQKKITTYGNKLFQRLPYEEYGLKTIPSLKERHKSVGVAGAGEVQVEFPSGWVEAPKVQQTLEALGSNEKQAFHRKWLIGSLIGLPAVAPFALVPV